MIILLNKKACAGKAYQKWRNVRGFFLDKLDDPEVFYFEKFSEMNKIIERKVACDENEFVAAGGDGTINCLLNSIMNSVDDSKLADIKIGAIGLGSSNDFHKPYDNNKIYHGVPYNIDFNNSQLRDIVSIKFSSDGVEKVKHFCINASLGLTAESNYFFNHPDKVLEYLKRNRTSIAIIYAAIKTLIKYKQIQIQVEADNRNMDLKAANIGIVKNCHFSGDMSYPGIIDYGNGMVDVHIFKNLNKLRILKYMIALSSGKYHSNGNAFSFKSDKIKITSKNKFLIEADGEIIQTNHSEIFVRKQLIGICT